MGNVKVALGRFARSGMETRFRGDMPAGVRLALSHYADRLRSGSPLIDPPRFFSEGQRSSDTASTIDLTLEPEVQSTLECEARRQHLPIEQVLVHAVFVYLADVDAGPGGTAVSVPPASLRLVQMQTDPD
jgi:hypothetical protein